MDMKAAIISMFVLVIILASPLSIVAETNESRSVTDALEAEQEQSSQPERPQTEQTEQDSSTAGSNEAEAPVVMSDQNTFLIFVQMIAALIFIIFLIYMLLRFINKRSQSYQSSQLMNNMGGVPLGTNKSIQLIKIGDRILVVGVGESIQLLKELDDPKEVERFMQMQQTQFQQFDQPLAKALSIFNGTFKQNKGTPEKKTSTSNEEAFKSILNKQLNEVSTTQEKIHHEVRERV